LKYLPLIFFLCLTANSLAQINFAEVGEAAGVKQIGSNYGVSVADYDNDGWEDIFIARTSGINKLYHNNGDGTFTNMIVNAGIFVFGKTQVGIWGDLDNDGWKDLYLANGGGNANSLFRNKGDGTFEDISAAAGVQHIGNPQSMAMADIDNDGFLDIYIADLDGPNVMYRNNGDLTFTDQTAQRGMTDNQESMGVIFFDYDNDDDLDLYLPHDNFEPAYLLKNLGNGNYINLGVASGTDLERFGMGTDVADINNDGWLDIYVTNLGNNDLLLNNGDATFELISESSNCDDPGFSWGTQFVDVDNDGFTDVFSANVGAIANTLFKNEGDLTFTDVSADTEIASTYNAFGMSTIDYNNDGKMDLIVANSTGSPGTELYLNESQNANHFTKIQLIGTSSNRDGIGSRVLLRAGNLEMNDVVTAGSGWSSQTSNNMHFGLGQQAMIDELMVRWPSGIIDTFENIVADYQLVITEGGDSLEIIGYDPIDPNPNVDTTIILAQEDKNIVVFTPPNATQEQAPNAQLFKIQPTLALNSIEIIFEDIKAERIAIYNSQGQVVEQISSERLKDKKVITFITQSLATGVYFVQCESVEGLAVARFVKL